MRAKEIAQSQIVCLDRENGKKVGSEEQNMTNLLQSERSAWEGQNDVHQAYCQVQAAFATRYGSATVESDLNIVGCFPVKAFEELDKPKDWEADPNDTDEKRAPQLILSPACDMLKNNPVKTKVPNFSQIY